MAVTSIWPIKGRVDQVINYARNPEKTAEPVREKQAALHTIDGVIEYAADDMKTEQRCYVTAINCREDTAAKQFMETKSYWTRHSGKDKMSGRVCYHAYQSFAAGEVNAETAHEIGVKLATQLWGEDFEVIVATHCNTGHYHNHFVLNSVSWRDGHKFHNGPEDYQPMRDLSDRLCLEYRLSVIEEPSGRGRNYGEYLAEKNGKPTNRSLIRRDIDGAVKASMTEREFYRYLESMGYEMKIYGENGRALKYPAIRPPGAKGYFRFHKLGGEGFTLDEIRERIARNYHRNNPLPEEEQAKVRQYRAQTQPHTILTGLHALYIRYCYELHIIQQHPASVKRVSFFMREDLIHLDRLDAQTRLLGENSIETIDDLYSFRTGSEAKLVSLENLRNTLRNELKRVTRLADSEEIDRVKGRIAETTEEMRKIRKAVRLCDGIEDRSKLIADELSRIVEEETRKEDKTNEQLFRGSSRAGRPYEPGRS